MKTVVKIDPEKEYEIAKNFIELAGTKVLPSEDLGSLSSSVDNLITVARVLIEREEQRRGKPRPPAPNTPKGRKKGDNREDSKKLPSLRYPNLAIKEEVFRLNEAPTCSCCQRKMKESGLFNTTEKLEVEPKKYYIRRVKRVIYNCSSDCGAMSNTSAIPSILPTSNYGDSLIIDVALSKYCDLIPIERYVQMAFRASIGEVLPAQSLIGLTHHLANFINVIYLKLKEEVLSALVPQLDETPHKMLEGDERHNWYLWGFFSPNACYFEAHDTRSGDVAYNFLKESKAIVIMTDGYAGYGKATRMIRENDGREVAEAYCNAHAYRYFEEASITWKTETDVFLKLYGEVYQLERERKEIYDQQTDEESLEFRQKMIPLFKEIKNHCDKSVNNVMPKSSLEKAINYLINHYDGLTLCTKNINIPLDNNLAEREIRGPVVGRKTWYGTHSKRGALTAAVLFSIVRSCLINNINPRNYFPWAVEAILSDKDVLTPYEYSKIINKDPPPSG
jgi:transposase